MAYKILCIYVLYKIKDDIKPFYKQKNIFLISYAVDWFHYVHVLYHLNNLQQYMYNQERQPFFNQASFFFIPYPKDRSDMILTKYMS